MGWFINWWYSSPPPPPKLEEKIGFWFGPRPTTSVLTIIRKQLHIVNYEIPPKLPEHPTVVGLWFGTKPERNEICDAKQKLSPITMARPGVPPVPPKEFPAPLYFPTKWFGTKPSQMEITWGKDNLVMTPPNYPPPPPPLPTINQDAIAIMIPAPIPTRDELANCLLGLRRQVAPARNKPKGMPIRDLQWWACVTDEMLEDIRIHLRRTKTRENRCDFQYPENTVLHELNGRFKEKND